MVTFFFHLGSICTLYKSIDYKALLHKFLYFSSVKELIYSTCQQKPGIKKHRWNNLWKAKTKLGFAENYVPFVKIPCHGFETTRKIGLHIQCYIGIMNTLTNVDHAQWSHILVVKFCSVITKYSSVSTGAAWQPLWWQWMVICLTSYSMD